MEESRTIVYMFPFFSKVRVCAHSVVPVFEIHTEEDSQVRSGHPGVKVLSTHECVMFIDSSRSE